MRLRLLHGLVAFWLFVGTFAAPPQEGATCRAPSRVDEDDAGSQLQVRVGDGVDGGVDGTSDDRADVGFADGVDEAAEQGMDPHSHVPEELLNVTMLEGDHSGACSVVLLTTVLGTRHDPVHTARTTPNFAYFSKFYRSVLEVPGGRAKAVIIHDMLPDEMTKEYSTPDGAISFVKVNLSRFDRLMSLNDLRYSLFEDQIKRHPEWDTVFMTDAADVTLVHNPCEFVRRNPDKVFVHSERVPEYKPDLRRRFDELGGKYLEWYNARPRSGRVKMLNAGIQGGKRSVVLKVLSKLNEVIQDPEISYRKRGKRFNVNMAAVNYVYRKYFPDDIVTGYPLHSKWLRHETRTDVYFRHK